MVLGLGLCFLLSPAGSQRDAGWPIEGDKERDLFGSRQVLETLPQARNQIIQNRRIAQHGFVSLLPAFPVCFLDRFRTLYKGVQFIPIE